MNQISAVEQKCRSMISLGDCLTSDKVEVTRSGQYTLTSVSSPLVVIWGLGGISQLSTVASGPTGSSLWPADELPELNRRK